MKLRLKSLRLHYFKGAKNVSLEFNPDVNWIHGKNESGKTTVFDSIWWLFFGKDSQGRADFSIKTYDKNNEIIPKVDHEVEAAFSLNGTERVFRRVYKEVWDKKSDTLKTHTTDYYVDGFPKATKGDYDQEVSQLFTEEVFKLLTNPLYLYSGMKMGQRREIVSSLVPDISNEDVLSLLVKNWPKDRPSNSIDKLAEILAIQSNLDAIKLKAARDKKALKEEKESIPARIDEKMRDLPEELDWSELETVIADKKAELADIDKQILNATERARKINQEQIAKDNKIFELERQLATIEREAREKANNQNKEQDKDLDEAKSSLETQNSKLKQLRLELSDIESSIKKGNALIDESREEIKDLEAKRATLKSEFEAESAKVFKVEGDCHYCGSELATAPKFGPEKEQEFNEAKKTKLFAIRDKGAEFKKKIAEIQDRIDVVYANRLEELNTKKAEISAKIDDITSGIQTLQDHILELKARDRQALSWEDFLPGTHDVLKNQIKTLKEENKQPTEDVVSPILEQKKALTIAIEAIQKELAGKKQIEDAKKRIEELKDQERELANRIAEQEGLEYAIFEFSRTKMEQIENRINSKFSLIHWKMFERQMNGEDKEVCEAILKGVPFPDLNTAGKVQAGIDIVNTFSHHYDLFLPVFIENM